MIASTSAEFPRFRRKRVKGQSLGIADFSHCEVPAIFNLSCIPVIESVNCELCPPRQK